MNTPVVIEIHDDGYIKVYAKERDIAIRFINRPYSEFDHDDAEMSECIDALVVKQLPYWHKEAYRDGKVIETFYKERWDVDRFERVRHAQNAIKHLEELSHANERSKGTGESA